MMRPLPSGRQGNPHYGNQSQPAPQMTFCRWLINMGYLQKLIAFTLAIMVVMPLVAHYYLGVAEMSGEERYEGDTRLSNMIGMAPTELRLHIAELYDIRQSVQKELRQLEENRKKVQEQLQSYTDQLLSVQGDLQQSRSELDRARTQIEQSMKEQTEVVERSLRHISAPLQILPQLKNDHPLEAPPSSAFCRQHNCFDYSRCSIVSPFRVYIYEPESVMPIHSDAITLHDEVTGALKRTTYTTSDPSKACIFLILLWDSTEDDFDEDDLEGRLHSLEYWRGDGRNHLVVSVSKDRVSRNILGNVNTGRAMLAQSFYTSQQFRNGFDIVLPPIFPVLRTAWKGGKFGPSYTPARRKYIISFQGSREEHEPNHQGAGGNGDHILSRKLKWFEARRTTTQKDLDVESTILNEFYKLKKFSEDEFLLDFQCGDGFCDGNGVGWCLCGNSEQRTSVLGESTFALILATDLEFVSTVTFLQRLSEALQYGAIPVILGGDVALPFGDFIHWNEAVIILPVGRVTELYYLLKTIQDNDLLSFRRQGAILWETYFSNPEAILSSVLATVRTRISVPANPIMEAGSRDLFPPGSVRRTEKVTKMTPESDDVFPPAEPPFSSPTFLRNFTSTYVDHHRSWNNPPGPFHLFPQNPLDPVMPSDAQFGGSSLGFRPIANGIGGSGKEYQESLGGNIPREQFTIVILTYQREAVLVSSVERLLGLPFLNKVRKGKCGLLINYRMSIHIIKSNCK